ncbi:MAG: 50S ribosomal protein L17 [Bacteroidota bacterium]
MRHGKKFNKLGRQKPHREAMMSNMAVSLIVHKRINTTVTKAKALRVYVEPLITKSKLDTTHSRRVVFSYLRDKDAVAELFRDVAPKVADRPGGYTRIIKTGQRLGDRAEMCMMELVDFNELMLGGGKEGKKAKTTRRAGGRKKATSKTEAAESTDETSTEATAEAPKKKAARKKKTDKSEE